MQLVIDAPDHLSPLVVRPDRSMSDDELFSFCEANPGYRIARPSDGDIVIMPGTGGKTSNQNMELCFQLQAWTKHDGRGKAFDSNGEFMLPNGAARIPDASWVSRVRLATLTPEQKERFLPLCPEFVVELKSPSERLKDLKAKMQEWIDNGAQL